MCTPICIDRVTLSAFFLSAASTIHTPVRIPISIQFDRTAVPVLHLGAGIMHATRTGFRCQLANRMRGSDVSWRIACNGPTRSLHAHLAWIQGQLQAPGLPPRVLTLSGRGVAQCARPSTTRVRSSFWHHLHFHRDDGVFHPRRARPIVALHEWMACKGSASRLHSAVPVCVSHSNWLPRGLMHRHAAAASFLVGRPPVGRLIVSRCIASPRMRSEYHQLSTKEQPIGSWWNSFPPHRPPPAVACAESTSSPARAGNL